MRQVWRDHVAGRANNGHELWVVLMLQAPSYSVGEVGWAMHPDVAGRGIATEAARTLVDLAFDQPILEDVSLEARKGSLTALVGPTARARPR